MDAHVRTGQPTVPLVKDTYASERRKAKTLNFSIAYGKVLKYFSTLFHHFLPYKLIILLILNFFSKLPSCFYFLKS